MGKKRKIEDCEIIEQLHREFEDIHDKAPTISIELLERWLTSTWFLIWELKDNEERRYWVFRHAQTRMQYNLK